MAYQSSSGLPQERASKIAHMELIKDESVIELLQSFRSMDPSLLPKSGHAIGRLEVSGDCPIRHIVTVDGGLSVVPNPIKREKALAFIQVGTCLLHLTDIERMQKNPMMDPRELKGILSKVGYRPAVLPLAGVSRPHMTVKETLRHSINSILSKPYSNLYWILEFLVFRRWMKAEDITDFPNMECYDCGSNFDLPREQYVFRCPKCNHEHFLSDYLQIGSSGADNWSREDAATAMMSVIEHLAAFEVPLLCIKQNQLGKLEQFLIIKDGPLLLRAALSRLVEPIRDLIDWIKKQDAHLHLIGVEKTGDFVNYINEHKKIFSDPEGKFIKGSYLLPSIQFLQEEIAGQVFNLKTYRNRVNYGSKVGVALSANHLVALNIPTGKFILEPKETDLIGFSNIINALSGLVSSSYENAIIPLVLANQAVSISYEPSGSILKQFVEEILDKN